MDRYKVFFGRFPKKIQYNFPKMRGGGVEGRLEFFLVPPPFPWSEQDENIANIGDIAKILDIVIIVNVAAPSI